MGGAAIWATHRVPRDCLECRSFPSQAVEVALPHRPLWDPLPSSPHLPSAHTAPSECTVQSQRQGRIKEVTALSRASTLFHGRLAPGDNPTIGASMRPMPRTPNAQGSCGGTPVPWPCFSGPLILRWSRTFLFPSLHQELSTSGPS